MASLPKFISASGAITSIPALLEGAVLHAGTSVTIYDGTDNTGTKIATITTSGEAQVLPRVECVTAIYAELAGTTPEATVFFS